MWVRGDSLLGKLRRLRKRSLERKTAVSERTASVWMESVANEGQIFAGLQCCGGPLRAGVSIRKVEYRLSRS